jgi:hypothetical protein
LIRTFGQMIADRLRSRDRVTGCERGGDFAMLILVALPERRVGVALFDLPPWTLVANANDSVVAANGQAVMRRCGSIGDSASL